MGPYTEDVIILKVINPAEKTEDETRGRIIDIYGDTVRAQFYPARSPAFTRQFKKTQLRRAGARMWRVTVIKEAERSETKDPAAGSTAA